MSEAPQILREICNLDFDNLIVEGLQDKERQAEIKIFRQKLRLIKRKLRDAEDTVKKTYDARKGDDEKQKQANELLPLNALDNLIAEIEIFLSELENAITFKRDLPTPPQIANFIIVTGNNVSFVTKEKALSICDRSQSKTLQETSVLPAKLRDEYAKLKHDYKMGDLSEATFEYLVLRLELNMVSGKFERMKAKVFNALQKITSWPMGDECINSFELEISITNHAELESWVTKLNKEKTALENVYAQLDDHPSLQSFVNIHLQLYIEALETLSKMEN